MNKYPEYKDSGIEWLGEIPSEWTLKPLKYISQFIVSNVDKKLNDDEIIVRLCNYSDVYNNDEISNELDFMKGSVKPSEFEKFKLQEGDVIITKDSETPDDIAIPAYVPVNYDDIVCGYHLAIIRNNGSLVGKYVYYLFKSYRFNQQFTVSARGITRFGLSQSAIANSIIGIPSTSEQTAIANFLDHKTQQIDDLIAKKQQLIELLKEERTAVINQAVTKGLDPTGPMKDSGIEWLGEIPEHWEGRRLATMGRFSKGRGISRDEIVEEGIPCIRYGEIYTEYDRVVYDPISRISEETCLKSERIQKGNVLFTGSGETNEDIGKSLVYYGDQDIFVGGDIIILKLYPNISALFMSFSLESNYVVQQKASYGKGGIIVHIYSKQLREIIVPIPPIVEQEKIAEFLEIRTTQIDKQINLLKDEIELFAEYKTSLINETVTGKIKVTDAP